MKVAPGIKIAPAIYQLKDRSWGWHKVKELTKVINNLLKLQRCKIYLEPLELVKSFQALSNISNRPFGMYYATSGEFKWLDGSQSSHDFNNDCYVPAGWGMDVIKAVKAGAIKASCVFKHDKNEYWGEKEDGSTFRIML
ncbi:MAG: hypothetical protein WC453_03155 [Patescibacteria group bacterium]